MRHWLSRIVWSFLAYAGAYGAFAEPLCVTEASRRAGEWMQGHPVMQRYAETITYIERMPAEGTGYFVFGVRLTPTGYLILNSDDRLPLVVAFSANSELDFTPTPDNAFRAFLDRHILTAKALLEALDTGQEITTFAPRDETGIAPWDASSDPVGPWVETSWNQCHPYNLYAPDDPSGTEYYGYRAPTGCVPTAYAQILRYHRWPIRGIGSHSYTDDQGSIQGPHTFDYDMPFAWGDMLPAYDPWNGDSLASQEAVATLMYGLGVAAEADFESDGTSSSPVRLGEKVTRHLYYEPTLSHTTQADLLPALRTDLQNGFPAVVSIPGHAVVADGHMIHESVESFHINYGWGGVNDGWWQVNNVAGQSIISGITSIRPSLFPFPIEEQLSTTAGDPIDLQWFFPVHRETEATTLNLYRHIPRPGPWTNDGGSFGTHAVINGWSIVPEGYSGDGWYAGPNGPATLLLAESFTPDADTYLSFRMQYRLGSAAFSVSVSADDGQTFTEIFSVDDNWPLAWALHTLPLGDFAGQPIRLLFELHTGSFYSDGGVWVDELEVHSGGWSGWELVAQDTTLASHRFSETTETWDTAEDFSIFEKTSTSDYQDWMISALDTGGTGFHKPAGGYGNREYHLTSRDPITPGPATRLLFRAKHELAHDRFDVLVSTDRHHFVSIWSTGGSSGWRDIPVDLSAYAGQDIYVRIEYVVDSFFADGGIWIEHVSLQDVTNPELEGQPLHYTQLEDLPAGDYTLAATISDHDGNEHPLSPSFALHVSPATTFRVLFYPGAHGERTGGAALEQWVSSGQSADAPEITPAPGWVFNGWDRSFDHVTEDIDVVALYEAKTAPGGTPYWWFIEHGLVDPEADDDAFHAAEESDPHNKGYTLRGDFIAGTHPNEPEDIFMIERAFSSTPSPGQTQVTLEWATAPRRTYRVYRHTDLATPWPTTPAAIVTGDGADASHVFTLDSSAKHFFKIEVSLDP